MEVVPFPEDFTNKGMYRRWTSSWNPDGYSETPQYQGQRPIKYPEDACLLECFYGGYIRES